jgi:small neutral amino acid transporter SnatA (MarC family)
MDLSPITSAIDVTTVAVAIIAAIALKMAPTVAKWAGNKLTSVFGR